MSNLELFEEPQIVHYHVFNPAKSYFKQNKNSKAECQYIKCRLKKCPLRDSGTCMLRPVFGWVKCPYGTYHVNVGPTRRARKFSDWIRQKEKEGPDTTTHLDNPPKKLAFVGEWVFLPYAHMDLCKAVPFVEHNKYLISGTSLIHRNAWTIENVLRLIDFRPQALFGGTITNYQIEQVPNFIFHIREMDPKMWNELIKARPELDVEPNYVGRKALLTTLKFPITFTIIKNPSYPVKWKWDGKTVTTTSKHSYSNIWGDISLKSLELKGIPNKNSAIVILDNSWVKDTTVFVD